MDTLYICWSFNTHNHPSDAILISSTVRHVSAMCRTHNIHTLPACTSVYGACHAQVMLIRVDRELIVFTLLLEVGFQHGGLKLYMMKEHPCNIVVDTGCPGIHYSKYGPT